MKERIAVRMILFLVAAFFIGLSGYLLRFHYGFVAIIVLGITGLLAGRAARIFRNWNKGDEVRSTRISKEMPQIASDWNYRPREINRRFAAVDSARADTAEMLNSNYFSVNETNINWFNFADPGPTVELPTVTVSSDRGRPPFEVRLKSYRQFDGPDGKIGAGKDLRMI